MKTFYKTLLLFTLTFVTQMIYAQSGDQTTFSSTTLLGKKWTITKKVNGEDMTYSLVFEKDSVTNTIVERGETKVFRYAYYLSNVFPYIFDESQVGTTSTGNWINMDRKDMIGGREKHDGGSMKIFKLTEKEFSFGNSPKFPLILTAEP